MELFLDLWIGGWLSNIFR